MSFPEQQENWEALAKQDMMWSVLSEPDKRGGKWDREEFYETGRAEGLDVLETLAEFDLPLKKGSVLDVGCGPGRVTHLFEVYFGEAVGYDLSPSMLEQARENAGPNETYVLNETDDLSPFSDRTFDFVYCSKVLQHVDPEKVGDYMAEMMRVLKPGGTLFLQMLSHPTGWPGTKESEPDPSFNGARYTVLSVSIDAMMKAFLYMNAIVYQARLVEKGEGQSIFSYDYLVQRRESLPSRPFRFDQA